MTHQANIKELEATRQPFWSTFMLHIVDNVDIPIQKGISEEYLGLHIYKL